MKNFFSNHLSTEKVTITEQSKEKKNNWLTTTFKQLTYIQSFIFAKNVQFFY